MIEPSPGQSLQDKLREVAEVYYMGGWNDLMRLAADELDRLRAENDALWNIADAVRFIKDRVPSWINDEIDELHRRRNAMRMVAPAPPGKEE